MKIPAIRAQIGIWVYYITALTFEQVSAHVKKVDDELHKSELLREMLQRSITDNYKNIANYILQQEERFFNALVLAAYDGDPQWHEVRLEYDNGEEFFDLGVLELTGKEKIFPVDGQHRVEGIKKVMLEQEHLKNERIPVIFIGHKKDDDGMKRARRMFSTLNRYAKPVSLRDIIALDEDDSIAIACRELIDNNSFFANNRIADVKNKAIPPNRNEFTTIITFYECNRELLDAFIHKIEIRDEDTGNILKGKRKMEKYIRFRPPEEEVDDFIKYCDDFWNDISDSFAELKDYKDMTVPNCEKYRHKDGGNLLFRPAALLAIVKVCALLKKQLSYDFNYTFNRIHKLPLELNSSLWRNILWEPASQKMLTTNQTTVIYLLLYCIDKETLNEKQFKTLIVSLKGLKQIDEDSDMLSFLEEYTIWSN